MEESDTLFFSTEDNYLQISTRYSNQPYLPCRSQSPFQIHLKKFVILSIITVTIIMFSLQPRDELQFGAPAPNYIPEPHEIFDSLIADPSFVQSTVFNFSTSTSSAKLQQPLGGQTGFRQRQTRKKDVSDQKRVVHRDIERKRRQDMYNLHASLRALLPLEFVKGKRSVCDQMQEAVNYIKQTEENIQKLQSRRDKLKRCCDVSGKETGRSNDANSLPNLVTVNLVGKEMEILISCGFRNTDFELSKMLTELLNREISVVSCVSTKINGRFLHKVLAEATDMKSLDVSALQERLSHVIELPWASKITQKP